MRRRNNERALASEIKLRDKVWIMHGSRPTMGYVYGIKHQCGIWPSMPDECVVEVRLRDDLCRPFEKKVSISEVFATKESLIASL